MAYPQDAASPALSTGLRRAMAFVLVLAAGQPGASAQPRPAPTAFEVPLSPECRVPGSQLYTTAQLPAVRTALREGHPLRLLAVGGSAAPGASASYPAKLEAALEQALPKVDVVIEHRGLPGEIASGAAERLRTMVAEFEPDLVVWQVGTHDAIARVDADAFASALAEAVAWVRSHGIDIVLIDPLYTASMAADADYTRIVEVVRGVAARQGVPLVRRYEALRYLSGRGDKGEGHMLGRQFRLNDLGLRCMAEHAALTIATSLHETPEDADPGRAAPAGAAPPAPAPAAPPPSTAPQGRPG